MVQRFHLEPGLALGAIGQSIRGAAESVPPHPFDPAVGQRPGAGRIIMIVMIAPPRRYIAAAVTGAVGLLAAGLLWWGLPIGGDLGERFDAGQPITVNLEGGRHYMVWAGGETEPRCDVKGVEDAVLRGRGPQGAGPDRLARRGRSDVARQRAGPGQPGGRLPADLRHIGRARRFPVGIRGEGPGHHSRRGPVACRGRNLERRPHRAASRS